MQCDDNVVVCSVVGDEPLLTCFSVKKWGRVVTPALTKLDRTVFLWYNSATKGGDVYEGQENCPETNALWVEGGRTGIHIISKI